jgi:hypothetical protein
MSREDGGVGTISSNVRRTRSRRGVLPATRKLVLGTPGFFAG